MLQICDSVLGKRVLMYWEIPIKVGSMRRARLYYGKFQLETFIFEFDSYHKDIHLAVVRISPIFTKFPSTFFPNTESCMECMYV